MYLLDANVISEPRKVVAGKADALVMKWSNGLDLTLKHISVITIHEIEIGIMRI
jgi:toxin FitB